jgi:lysyl-tRNA synthetase class I
MFIRTKYLGPTNYRGGRVKASTITGKSVTVDWDHGANVEANHTRAAIELAKRMEWPGRWVGLSNDSGGYAFTSVNAPVSFEVTP